MKVIVCHGYGPPDDVLRLTDIEEPEVTDDEVLVRVHACRRKRPREPGRALLRRWRRVGCWSPSPTRRRQWGGRTARSAATAALPQRVRRPSSLLR